jgi:hypothetical protein
MFTESALLRTMDAIQAAAPADAAVPAGETARWGNRKKKARREELRLRRKLKRKGNMTVDDDERADDVGNLFYIDRVGDRDVAATLALGIDVPGGNGDDSKRGADVDIIDLSNDDDVAAAVVVEATTAIAGGDDNGKGAPLDAVRSKLDCFDSIEKGEGSTKQISGSTSAKYASTVATSATATFSTEEFRFVIDKEGLKELGGNEDNGEDGVGAVNRSNLGASTMNDEAPLAVPPSDLGQLEVGEPIKLPYSSDVTNDRKNTIFDVNDDFSDDDAAVVKNDDKDNNDDDDSADKLSSYYQRNNRLDATSSGNNFPMDVKGRASSSSSVILLDHYDSSEEKEYLECDSSDSDTDSEFLSPSKATNPKRSMEIMELSITSNKISDAGVRPEPAVVGPRGKVRTRVVSALLSLTRQLRMSSKFTHTIECRTKARVPIINCSTRMGFEGDIAIGGHNGVDTSMYAKSQVKRFRR